MIQKGDEVWFVTAGDDGLRRSSWSSLGIPVRPEVVRGVVTAVRSHSADVKPAAEGPIVAGVLLHELFTDPDAAADLCAARWESICERRVKVARASIAGVEDVIAGLERHIAKYRADIEQLRITEREPWK